MARELCETARNGGGFATYITDHRLDRPGAREKRVYVAIGGDWFVGSGISTESL